MRSVIAAVEGAITKATRTTLISKVAEAITRVTMMTTKFRREAAIPKRARTTIMHLMVVLLEAAEAPIPQKSEGAWWFRASRTV